MPFNRSQQSELTNEQFLLIGKIVVEFSTIELLQSLILNRLLLSPSFLGRAYTENTNAAQIQAMLKNACDIHTHRYNNKIISKEVIENIESTCKKSDKLREQRNKFAHYCWSRWTDEQIFGIRVSGKHFNETRFDEGTSLISVDDLRNLQQKTYTISDEFFSIFKKLPELEENKNLINLLQYPT